MTLQNIAPIEELLAVAFDSMACVFHIWNTIMSAILGALEMFMEWV